MASRESNAAIFAGIVGALAITTTKFIAAAIGGSAAMLASGIHSGVDTVDNILLYVGKRRSARPGDTDHPFGHGPELYFWSLIVAVLMFTIAGVVTIAEGVFRIIKPEKVNDLTLNFVVFGIAACFNIYSLVTAIRQFLRENRGNGFRQKLVNAKDPTVLTVLFEDSAALLGVLCGFLGVLLGYLLKMPILDGVASIVIGVLMATVASGLIYQCKTLLGGETANDEVLHGIRELLCQDETVEEVIELRTMHRSPDDVLVNLKVRFHADLLVQDLALAVERVEEAMRRKFPELKQIFIEPVRPREAA